MWPATFHPLSDEEDEGLDAEEVNFNEMVLDDEARLAVRNKRGRKFERIEFSNRFAEWKWHYRYQSVVGSGR